MKKNSHRVSALGSPRHLKVDIPYFKRTAGTRSINDPDMAK